MGEAVDIVYEAVIGVEVHAELATQSKMFCGCAVVDPTTAAPNVAVCPICAGMPGTLPVVNARAVELGARVGLALECELPPISIFARKNYFYPDLPKGYQISQYEEPLAVNGRLLLAAGPPEQWVRIRRVHLEEDTGKLTHLAATETQPARSLVDLNRAGVPLLEIVTEPDLHSAEDVRRYAMRLHALLRTLGVNSGDLEKGVMRLEPNISLRPRGSTTLGTRTEIKNLNSFRALERAVAFEIVRQTEVLRRGAAVVQETRGWDEATGTTFSQRSKEEAHDYRYFPEPDLPPLVLSAAWIAAQRQALPELPLAKVARFQQDYGLSAYDAEVLAAEPQVATYYEATVTAAPSVPPKTVANWISGELFALANRAGTDFEPARLPPEALATLLALVGRGELNAATAKTVLGELYAADLPPDAAAVTALVARRGLRQISDAGQVAELVAGVLAAHPTQAAELAAGKESLERWFFGQIMRAAGGQANPQVVQAELRRQVARDPSRGDT
jgi:aspartyl-tRNA(Asn)/glutamyl-tRNA(Gln) amidotransferase subunit B